MSTTATVVPVVLFPKGLAPRMQDPGALPLIAGCESCGANVFIGEYHSYHCSFLGCSLCGVPSVHLNGHANVWPCPYGI